MEYRQAFANALIDVAKDHDEVILVESDIASPARDWFKRYAPTRFINTGIAEQNAIGVCAGLASQGFIPFYYTYGFIIERTYNQIKQSIIQNNADVKIFAYNCGATGMGGASHNEIYDLALMKMLPGVKIFTPTSYDDVVEAVRYSLYENGPVYVRFPRGHIDEVHPQTYKDADLTVYAVGATYGKAVQAAASLINESIDVIPVNTFTIPIIMRHSKSIIVVEDHAMVGGFGESVGRYLAESDYRDKFKIVGLSNALPPCNNGEYGITFEKLRHEFEYALKELKELKNAERVSA